MAAASAAAAGVGTDAVARDTEERITTSLRKGLLELCVLALLARRDRYGLELADDLVTRGLLWTVGKLQNDGTPASGYSAR